MIANKNKTLELLQSKNSSSALNKRATYPDSPYFQSETFNKVLLFLQNGSNKAKLKQVDKNGVLLVKDIKSMSAMHRFLTKAMVYQK